MGKEGEGRRRREGEKGGEGEDVCIRREHGEGEEEVMRLGRRSEYIRRETTGGLCSA